MSSRTRPLTEVSLLVAVPIWLGPVKVTALWAVIRTNPNMFVASPELCSFPRLHQPQHFLLGAISSPQAVKDICGRRGDSVLAMLRTQACICGSLAPANRTGPTLHEKEAVVMHLPKVPDRTWD